MTTAVAVFARRVDGEAEYGPGVCAERVHRLHVQRRRPANSDQSCDATLTESNTTSVGTSAQLMHEARHNSPASVQRLGRF